MYKKLLMPTDGSECSFSAIKEGLEVAKALGAEVNFLYVVENPSSYIWMSPESIPYGMDLLADLQKAGKEALDRASKMAAEAGVKANTLLKEGQPIPAILEEAKNHDALVMGTHGRAGLDKLLLGSVTEGVLHRTNKPVLVVRSK
ncbi:MAG: universal stress protein [Deinococcus sp.]|nr:universal stress protein [Deinococcus sp.]MCL5964542.1 universal stress protein [Deinococcus sp.]